MVKIYCVKFSKDNKKKSYFFLISTLIGLRTSTKTWYSENVGHILLVMGRGKSFLNKMLVAQEIRPTVSKWLMASAQQRELWIQ